MKAIEILEQGVEFMQNERDVNPLSHIEITSEIHRYIDAIAELKEKTSC